MAQGNYTRFLKVSHFGLGEFPVTDAAVPYLDGAVAVDSVGLDLSNNVALAESDNGDGNNRAGGLEEAHHAELRPH